MNFQALMNFQRKKLTFVGGCHIGYVIPTCLAKQLQIWMHKTEHLVYPGTQKSPMATTNTKSYATTARRVMTTDSPQLTSLPGWTESEGLQTCTGRLHKLAMY